MEKIKSNMWKWVEAILVTVLTSLPFQWLWNWLMPVIFGLPEITVLQALGLILLSNVLFKKTIYK